MTLPGLADAVGAIDGLRLGRGVPPRVEQEAVVGFGEVEPEPAALRLIRNTGAVPSLKRCNTAARSRVRRRGSSTGCRRRPDAAGPCRGTR